MNQFLSGCIDRRNYLNRPFFKKVYAYTSAQQGINHKSGGVKTMEEKIKF